MRRFGILAGIAILAVAGYFWWQMSSRPGDIAFLKANPAPYKIPHPNAADARVDNTDSALLSNLDTPNREAHNGEVLIPPESTPELPPVEVEVEVAPTPTPETASEAGLTEIPIPQPKIEPEPEPEPQVASNIPLYRVQLGAFRDEARAKRNAALLTEKHRARLKSGESFITIFHDANELGQFWRVVSAPMPRNDAQNFCNVLKSVGQNCILSKAN